MRNKIVEEKSNSPDVKVHEKKSTEKRGIYHTLQLLKTMQEIDLRLILHIFL